VSCVGTAADGSEAVSLVDELRPDVVLMDLSMPGTDGIEATRQVRSSHPEVAVLVLTTFADDRHVMAAVDAGAVGYLLKDSGPEQLLAGIEAAARGESPLDPRVAGALMTSRREAAPPEVSLTAREREVLALVVEGMANKQIARRLGISEKTVKAHLTSVFAALGVSDRTQAALWAERHPDRLV
ncbi:MAG: response regulator transcription factor, partial [Acidimicrobiales bacterium]|nr:response regulator transcription factor [Acidimicrobiales bacterium]